MPEQPVIAVTGPDVAANGRVLPGAAASDVTGFISALVDAHSRLAAVADRLETARVHDEAFGKLIDAAKVRDAYHQRLPATEHNLDEARAVIEHLLAEFTAAPGAAARPDPAS